MGFAQDRGRHAETLAAAYLELTGLRVHARNVRWGGVEVDLVATEGDVHVLVEVRWRARPEYGSAAASVMGDKRARLRRAAAAALQRGARHVRIDVVAIDRQPDGLRLTHHRNAVHD